MRRNKFRVLDEEITGVASDYLIECRKTDGTVLTEWVTLPGGTLHDDTKFALVGPPNGPRILPIKEKKKMASYIKFPLVFPASEWKAGKGIIVPVAGTKVYIQTNDNAPDWAAEAFSAINRFVKRAGDDAFIEVMISFDEDKGDVGEKAVYLNLDGKSKPIEVSIDDYEDQGDLTDPDTFLALLEASGYSGKLASSGSRKAAPKTSGGRPARDTSGGSSRPKRRAQVDPDDEDDDEDVEETPKKRVVPKTTKVVNKIENAITSDKEALMYRMILLIDAAELLKEALDIDDDKALEVANMQLCNIANGGKITN